MIPRDVIQIIIENKNFNVLPVRVKAIRRNGNIVEAGDKFLNQAVIKLMFVLTGAMFRPTDIKKRLLKVRDRVSFPDRILEVL